jgi:oxaloacetate decarboxylase alpha subunit
VLNGEGPVTCRPADLLKPEFETLKKELVSLQAEKGLIFGENIDDDVLTYVLFPQPGLKFLANRNNADAFEPKPQSIDQTAVSATLPTAVLGAPEVYTVEVEGQAYVVRVTPGGDIESATPAGAATGGASVISAPSAPATTGITAPLAGNVFKVLVNPGDVVASGDVVVVLEAMKMETEIRTSTGGTVNQVLARDGDAVAVGATLVTLN